jgi:FKBP12-rapamycin complex-associated protein
VNEVELKRAADALGHIVQLGGTTIIEDIEHHLMVPALEWLESDNFQVRRHAAVLILKQLAVHAPTLFFQSSRKRKGSSILVEYFLDYNQVAGKSGTSTRGIWAALTDSKANVRYSAAEALQACLKLISQREAKHSDPYFQRVKSEMERGLASNKSNSNAILHGSLLTMRYKNRMPFCH